MEEVASLAKRRPVLSTAVLGVGLACVLKAVWRTLKRRRRPGQEVPYAKGWRPFVGHLPVLLKYMKDNNKLAAGRLALGVKEEQGMDIFKVQMFGAEITVLSDLAAIDEIISNDPEKYSKDFDSLPAFKLTKSLFGNGLFFASTDTEAWSVAHNILKAPFSIKGMKALFPLMVEQGSLLVKCLEREVGYGGICHIDHWVTKMAFETIAVCATGTSFGSFEDDQDPLFVKAMNNIITGFKPLTMFPPFLWSVLFPRTMAKFRVDGKFMRDTCIEVIRKRREHETHSAVDRKDLMDMMLNDKDPKTGKAMTEEMIVDNILTFLFAGQDSTAAAMGTLMCFLNANPRCKEKLLKEIDEVVGVRELEWDDLSALQYLDWCVKEALRLVPPAAAIVRTANGDQLLQGKWRVDAGTMVMIGIMAVHYNKQLWGEDSADFRPERWQDGPPHKHAFLPFAAGPRACTGREFSLIEQKVTIVKLLQHFDFRRPEKVEAQEGYTTLRKQDQTMVPFIDMDIEFKTVSAFIGMCSAFELLQRVR